MTYFAAKGHPWCAAPHLVIPANWIVYDRAFARYSHGVEDAHAWIIPQRCQSMNQDWWQLRQAPIFTHVGPATLEELRDLGPPPARWPRYTPAYVMALACWFPSGDVARVLGTGRRNVERICRMLGPKVIAHLPKFAHRRIYARYQ